MSDSSPRPSDDPRIVIALRPLGSALPLGFFAFGIGMLLLAANGAGWIAQSEGKHVGLLLAAFVFPLELTAAVLALLSRDVFAGTGLGLFSTSWLATGLVLLTGRPGTTSGAFGIYLLGFAGVILPLGLAAFSGKPLIGVILLTAMARSLLDGLYELGGTSSLHHAAGVLGAVIAGLAWYGGSAFLFEDMRGRPLLPTLRRGASRSAMDGRLRDQLAQARDDAGVRQQL